LASRWQIGCLTFKKKEKIVAHTHGIPNPTEASAKQRAPL
jgi:hypothetical protein